MYNIREIAVSEHIDHVADLTRAHWLETEPGMTVDGPRPAVDLYIAMEQAGSIIALGAFHGSELIGYSVAFVATHLHYGFPYAHHDLLFVRQDHRRGSLGLRLIRRTEEAAKSRGAHMVLWHVKPKSTLESIVTRTGYTLEEAVYRKDL